MSRQSSNSVPVSFAAKAYGKDPSWVRAGIITGYLPIGTATRNGHRVTSIDEMDSKYGRINYYISPKLFFEETGVKWNGNPEKIPGGAFPENFIDKNRYLELKYFCLQYPNWKRTYKLVNIGRDIPLDEMIVPKDSLPSDPTAKQALQLIFYKERLDLIEQTCKETSDKYWRPLLERVTKVVVQEGIERPTDEEFDKLYALFFVKLHRKRG